MGARYSLGSRIVAAWPYGALVVGAFGYALGPTPMVVAGLVLVFVGALGSPRAALALAVAVVPAYLHGRSIGGYRFSPHTTAITLVALALAGRWLVGLVRQSRARGPGDRTGLFALAQAGSGAEAKAGYAVPGDRTRPCVVTPRRLDLAVAVLVLCGAASLVVTIRPEETARALREVIVVPVLFYYGALIAFGRDPWARPGIGWLAGAIVIGALASALIGLAQLALDVNLITAEGAVRIRALYGSPNNLGLLLGRAIPLAVALALAGRHVRLPYLLALAPLFLALALTYSVGAWLGVGAALLAVALLSRRRGPWLLIGGLVVVALVALPFLHVERVVSHLSFDDSTSFFRLKIWQSSLLMLRDFPLTGIGLSAFQGHYDPALGGRYMLPEAWQESTISHPHNLILDSWLSLGLAGLVAMGVLAVGFARDARRVWLATDARAPGEAERARLLIVGTAGTMVALVVHGLIDNSYFLPDLAVLFWAAFAIVRVLASSPVAAPANASPLGRRSGEPPASGAMRPQ